MKVELLVLLITGFFVVNTYYDGKYITILKSWTKYYQMAGIAFAGMSAYLFFKKYPSDTRTLLSSASGVIKYLPIDKNTSDVLTPFLQMTKQNTNVDQSQYSTKLRQSGGSNKRSVSETKKKYVASQQGWCCGNCNKTLPAWFEVDHTVRLDNGGTNNIDNLVALCRDCHGQKTSLENL